MPDFPYALNTPDGPNNPSDDQPNMKINTNSSAAIWDIDHYGFGVDFGGLHQIVSLTHDGASGIPSSRLTNQGTIYPKFDSTTGETQAFYTPDQTANEYQMTRTQNANFATFSTNTAYSMSDVNLNGGWTFLPGGMLLQYGLKASPTNSGTIIFPVPFTTPAYSITLTPQFAFPNLGNFNVQLSGLSATSFNYSGTAPTTGLYWMAIGI